MIAISQEKNTFYYIHWIPSEKGPLVLNYGKEIVKDESNSLYYNALDSIRIKIKEENFIYSLSIDSNSALYSETNIDDDFDHFDILDWFNEHTIGNQSDTLIETFHYPFSNKQKKYLNVHFKTDIKNKIKVFAQNYNSEIRNVGLGIFSAEVTSRAIYNADYNNSYAILKILKDSEALIIKKGELVSYIKFTIKQNKINIKVNYGDITESKRFLKNLEDVIINKINKIKTVDHIYYYQGKGKYKEVENLLNTKKINATSMNIFSKLKFDYKKKISDVEGMQFAETGASFWGLDV